MTVNVKDNRHDVALNANDEMKEATGIPDKETASSGQTEHQVRRLPALVSPRALVLHYGAERPSAFTMPPPNSA